MSKRNRNQNPWGAPDDSTRADINRANAAHSTGPITPEGKAASAQNSTKHGLFAKSAFLPTDDPQAYAAHHAKLTAEIQPADYRETVLTQDIADLTWRIQRAHRFENALESALTQPAPDGPEGATAIPLQLIAELHRFSRTLDRYYKMLRERWTELKDLQDERKQQFAEQFEEALVLAAEHEEQNPDLPFNPGDYGFVLTAAQFQAEMERQDRLTKRRQAAA